MTNTAALARSITWSSSRQSYLTARLLADRELVDDCMRAYAYFRWADDMIDIKSTSASERRDFIARQKQLINDLYLGKRPTDLCHEEEILADLVKHDRGPDSGLHSFIINFMAMIEFDANRKGGLVTRKELSLYSSWLATAVMDGIQYFIGNDQHYPKTMDRPLSVLGAHIVHMLRDTLEDIPAGFVNIPLEDIQQRGINIKDETSEPFRVWVREEVERAQACLHAGRGYINHLGVLRCKLAGAWYCARFEWFLKAIRRDEYQLRSAYPERHTLGNWVKMIGLGVSITLGHFLGKISGRLPNPDPHVALGPESSISMYTGK